jgi:SNF2 family DNA or RNA helicase
VADEAQAVKNPLSRTARELRALPAGARIALSGTPVENRLSDLWALLDWTTPGLLGPLDIFRRTVAVPLERHRDAEATEKLGRVVRPFLLRGKKSDPGIAPELPRKTETDRIVPLTSEQATLYGAVVEETLAEIAATDGMQRRGKVLALITALKQICNHPAQYLGEKAPLTGRSGKLDALDEVLDVVLAEGESALVFSQYVGMARLLESHLHARGIATRFLHGGVPAARRQALVQDFQAGAAPVFCCR